MLYAVGRSDWEIQLHITFLISVLKFSAISFLQTLQKSGSFPPVF